MSFVTFDFSYGIYIHLSLRSCPLPISPLCLFMSLSSQRSKEKEKKITPDLRLYSPWTTDFPIFCESLKSLELF